MKNELDLLANKKHNKKDILREMPIDLPISTITNLSIILSFSDQTPDVKATYRNTILVRYINSYEEYLELEISGDKIFAAENKNSEYSKSEYYVEQDDFELLKNRINEFYFKEQEMIRVRSNAKEFKK